MEKRLLKLSNRLIDSLVFLCLLTAFVYAAYALWDVNTIYSHAEAGNFTEYKPSADSPEAQQSFEELRKLNPDVLGWLTIYDTAIDYPLVQTDDNFTYLDTTVEGEYSAAGSLYLDYRNRPDFSDWNTIIHGHHMAAHAMFGDIGLYEKKDHYEAHRYGDLFYDGRHYGLEIFALALTDTSDHLLFTPGVEDEASRAAYLDRLRELSRQRTDIAIEEDDRILVMATCSSIITNGRHMLVAKILDEPVVNPFPESRSKDELMKARTGMSALFTATDEGRLTKFLLLLALIFLLGLLTYLLLERKIKVLERAIANPPRPRRRRGYQQWLVIGLCLLTLGLGRTAVLAQKSPLEETRAGFAANLSFTQYVHSRFYGVEPPQQGFIRYALEPQEPGNPMPGGTSHIKGYSPAIQIDNPVPGGTSSNSLLFDLRIGAGDADNNWQQIKQLQPITITGKPPQQYNYKLKALYAYGSGAADIELDKRVYDITLQLVEISSNKATSEPKLLMTINLPLEGKVNTIEFNHTYTRGNEGGPGLVIPIEGIPPTKPGESLAPGEQPTASTPASTTEPTRPIGKGGPDTGERGLSPWLLLLVLLILTALVIWRLYLGKKREIVSDDAPVSAIALDTKDEQKKARSPQSPSDASQTQLTNETADEK